MSEQDLTGRNDGTNNIDGTTVVHQKVSGVEAVLVAVVAAGGQVQGLAA